MANENEELKIREWNYDQSDPAESAASRRKTKEKKNTGITENLLKQIFPS